MPKVKNIPKSRFRTEPTAAQVFENINNIPQDDAGCVPVAGPSNNRSKNNDSKHPTRYIPIASHYRRTKVTKVSTIYRSADGKEQKMTTETVKQSASRLFHHSE